MFNKNQMTAEANLLDCPGVRALTHSMGPLLDGPKRSLCDAIYAKVSREDRPRFLREMEPEIESAFADKPDFVEHCGWWLMKGELLQENLTAVAAKLPAAQKQTLANWLFWKLTREAMGGKDGVTLSSIASLLDVTGVQLRRLLRPVTAAYPCPECRKEATVTLLGLKASDATYVQLECSHCRHVEYRGPAPIQVAQPVVRRPKQICTCGHCTTLRNAVLQDMAHTARMLPDVLRTWLTDPEQVSEMMHLSEIEARGLRARLSNPAQRDERFAALLQQGTSIKEAGDALFGRADYYSGWPRAWLLKAVEHGEVLLQPIAPLHSADEVFLAAEQGIDRALQSFSMTDAHHEIIEPGAAKSFRGLIDDLASEESERVFLAYDTLQAMDFVRLETTLSFDLSATGGALDGPTTKVIAPKGRGGQVRTLSASESELLALYSALLGEQQQALLDDLRSKVAENRRSFEALRQKFA